MTTRAIFVTGGSGYLGHELLAQLEARGYAARSLTRKDGIDLLEPFELAPAFDAILRGESRPPLLIHLAARARQALCDQEPELAYRANGEATGALMAVLRRFGGRMLYSSTDLVFSGEHAPYRPDSDATPASVYGRSKLQGERFVLASSLGLVVRIPLLYGPSFDSCRGASDSLLAAARAGQELRLFEDEWRTPLLVREAAQGIIDLALTDTVCGLRHLPGPARLSRLELGRQVLAEAGLQDARITPIRRAELPGPLRPRDCSLV